MLHNITADGELHWHCHHDECAPLTAQISDSRIEWMSDDLVALPPCACGSRCFVKVKFSQAELAAPNMQIEEREDYTEQVIDQGHEELRKILAQHANIDIPSKIHLVKQSRIVGVSQHPAVARHAELARQLVEIGSVPPTKQK